MTGLGVAIAVHVVAIVWWIGGLAFVTLVLLPALRAELGGDPHTVLATIEGRFAPQARIAAGLVGLSGGYMLWGSGLWQMLDQPRFWWLDAMIGYWFVFVLMLFVIEPSGILQRLIFAGRDPTNAWRRFHALHVLLLGVAVIIIAVSTAAAGTY